MHEVLQKVSNAKTKKEKIALLKEYNTQALRSLFIINFDDTVISMLPPGDVPYTPNDAPEGTEHTLLEKEARLLHHFFKGGSNVSQVKRENMFIQMLEGLNKGEAEVLILAKDKKIGKRWKITKACVSEAFPSIQWGGRS
jgi:hypothetical protein|tara:strand:+ start:162 stop:581 length:420 start_codon:yes stop_codon:yes gene_type:complete